MTMGEIILNKRKQLGMTQSDLASKLNVTDKAVSKWERNASCPDIGTIPKLAEVLGLDIDELMCGTEKARTDKEDIFTLILNAIPLAMGVAVCVLSFTKQLEPQDGIGLLGIGMVCLAMKNFRK